MENIKLNIMMSFLDGIQAKMMRYNILCVVEMEYGNNYFFYLSHDEINSYYRNRFPTNLL